jgi:anaerobic magnesium-protoporphyrin IX monomethyl ester cyclase
MIVVGPPANEFGMMMASNPGVDAVATPEYDFTLVELAQAIEEGRGFQGIRGIIYRREDGKVFRNPPRGPLTSEELDRMSFVSKVYKEHLNIKDYFLSSSLYPEIQIFTARGCPYKCSFCSWPQTFTGRQYRPRSIPNVMEELEFIRNEMPQVNEVFIEDDTFTIYKERVLEYCNEVRRRKLDKIPWSCNVRANGVDYETLVALKRAGCRMIITGYESGSDVILRNIVKGANVEQARRFTKEAKRAGLLIQGDFIIGLPGETKETIRETRRFIDEIRPNFLQVAIATPIPGTSFYQWAQANNAIVVDDLSAALDSSGFQRSIISYDGLSAEEIDESVDQILKDYYLTPKYVPIAMSNVLRRNGLKEAHLIAKAAKPFMFKYLRRNKPPAFGSVPEEVQELDLIR